MSGFSNKGIAFFFFPEPYKYNEKQSASYKTQQRKNLQSRTRKRSSKKKKKKNPTVQLNGRYISGNEGVTWGVGWGDPHVVQLELHTWRWGDI